MAYDSGFAYVYNQRWAGFAKQVGPAVLDYYEGTELGRTNRSLLDLCCGTGQLARIALDRGYRTVGVDLSAEMLAYAVANNREHVAAGRAHLIQADARDFTMDQRFGLVVATYDALNHLDSTADLARCFQAVRAVTAPGGSFIFDLNTRKALRSWTGIQVTDEVDLALIQRFFYDEEQGRAHAAITGFIHRGEGRYERFAESLHNTAFEMVEVVALLETAGWQGVRMARLADLTTPLAEPEAERRVFFLATNPG